MRVEKCKNGHFFDVDTYDKCPICEAEVVTSADNNHGADNSGGPGKVGAGNSGNPGVVVGYGASEKGKNSDGNDNFLNKFRGLKALLEKSNSPETVLKEINNAPKNTDNMAADNVAASNKVDDYKTEAIYDEQASATAQHATFDDEKTEAMFMPGAQVQSEPAAETKKVEDAYSMNPAVESLQDAVQHVSASDDGKTMSFFSAAIENVNKPIQDVEPVVGWLVCVSGSHFGEAFVINAGMNSIGRNTTNSIVLNKDGSVSREKHAFIIYEPKKREFFVKPGESSGLTYVNEDYITETRKILERDVLEVGGSKLVFVPLCGPDFSWEEYMAEK